MSAEASSALQIRLAWRATSRRVSSPSNKVCIKAVRTLAARSISTVRVCASRVCTLAARIWAITSVVMRIA